MHALPRGHRQSSQIFCVFSRHTYAHKMCLKYCSAAMTAGTSGAMRRSERLQSRQRACSQGSAWCPLRRWSLGPSQPSRASSAQAIHACNILTLFAVSMVCMLPYLAIRIKSRVHPAVFFVAMGWN